MNIELSQNMLNVIADSVSADVKLIGDAAGRAAFCQQSQDLQLAFAEPSLSRC